MSKITVFLHGPLAKRRPEPTVIVADTVAQAIKGYCKLTRALDPTPGHGRLRIRIKGYDQDPSSWYKPIEDGELHLYPDFRGGGGGGFLNIVIGAVIIVAAILLAPYTGGTSLYAIGFGASLAIGGLISLISPAPKPDTSTSFNFSSKYLGTPKNTTKIGTRIPLIWGKQRVYGQYVSYNIVARDVNPQYGSNLPGTSGWVYGNDPNVTTANVIEYVGSGQ